MIWNRVCWLSFSLKENKRNTRSALLAKFTSFYLAVGLEVTIFRFALS